jgi:preprotein translocase subunit SecA
VSLEDDLMRIFGPSGAKSMMERLGWPEDEPIQHSMVSKAIETAQAKIEGFNFDVRKHVLEYDDVLSKQRDTIYKLRNEILFGDEAAIQAHLGKMASAVGEEIVRMHTEARPADEWNFKAMAETIAGMLPDDSESRPGAEDLRAYSADGTASLAEHITSIISREVLRKTERIPGAAWRSVGQLALRIIDMLWVDHLEMMESLRDSVRLRAYGQRDPLIEYKREGHRIYRVFMSNLSFQVVQWILKVPFEPQVHIAAKNS